MPSRPGPLPAAQRTARPRSRSRAAKAAAKAGKPSRSKRPSAAARAGTSRSASRLRARCRRGVDLREPGDAGRCRGDPLLEQVDADADHRDTGVAARHGLDQHAAQLSAGLGGADQPEVVGPLQADAKRCAGARIERLGEGDADGEREAREVDAGGERPGEREGERGARRRLPGASEAASPGGLPLGDEGARGEHASASASRAQASRSALVEAVSATRSISTAAGPPVFTSPSVRAWCRGTCGCRSGRRTAASPSSSAGPRAPGRSRSSALRPARCRAGP